MKPNKPTEISQFRKDYQAGALSKEKVVKNPFQQFENWFQEALDAPIMEPNAMIVATASSTGIPSVRTVLLKGYSPTGFIFYTNYNSRKGKELVENPKAALLFYWDILERQIRIEGDVSKTSNEISDQYYSQRPKGSQIGAWVSPQSAVIDSRGFLENKTVQITEQYSQVESVPRPPHWGGFVLKPTYFEYWQGRSNRLHDRICYTQTAKNTWKIERLAP